MKKTLAATALALATATSAAFAEPVEAPKPQTQAEQVAAQAVPVELTDQQMDRVTAGIRYYTPSFGGLQLSAEAGAAQAGGIALGRPASVPVPLGYRKFYTISRPLPGTAGQ